MRATRGLFKTLSRVAMAATVIATVSTGAVAGGLDPTGDTSLLAFNYQVIEDGVYHTGSSQDSAREARPAEQGVLLPATAVMLKSRKCCRVGGEFDLAARATGGGGGYEYCFWLEGPGAPAGMNVRGYSSSDRWSWKPSAADVGLNTITVWARSIGSPNEYDASATYTIQVLGD